jgi:hypothetical protein
MLHAGITHLSAETEVPPFKFNFIETSRASTTTVAVSLSRAFASRRPTLHTELIGRANQRLALFTPHQCAARAAVGTFIRKYVLTRKTNLHLQPPIFASNTSTPKEKAATRTFPGRPAFLIKPNSPNWVQVRPQEDTAAGISRPLLSFSCLRAYP